MTRDKLKIENLGLGNDLVIYAPLILEYVVWDVLWRCSGSEENLDGGLEWQREFGLGGKQCWVDIWGSWLWSVGGRMAGAGGDGWFKWLVMGLRAAAGCRPTNFSVPMFHCWLGCCFSFLFSKLV